MLSTALVCVSSLYVHQCMCGMHTCARVCACTGVVCVCVYVDASVHKPAYILVCVCVCLPRLAAFACSTTYQVYSLHDMPSVTSSHRAKRKRSTRYSGDNKRKQKKTLTNQ